VALVTGTNKSIGLEIARQLGHLGCTVLIGTRDERSVAVNIVQTGLIFYRRIAEAAFSFFLSQNSSYGTVQHADSLS
jgi:NAD(P)-dependent dehydrogenase (short-subunit alcohol dehydrogenase family)